ncbi:MAG: OB-fold domain-containing protein [Comamonas sp.]|nr:OB-fold domain-containing protein [Comamonas sp.]
MTKKIEASPLGTYRAYLQKEQLAYQYSPEAGRAVFFPRLVCPFSGSTHLEWRVSKGLGEVHASTVVYPKDAQPYNVALIELDEGFRMMSRVEDMDPHNVKIGQRVRVRFVVEAGAPAPLPVFVPQEEENND